MQLGRRPGLLRHPHEHWHRGRVGRSRGCQVSSGLGGGGTWHAELGIDDEKGWLEPASRVSGSGALGSGSGFGCGSGRLDLGMGMGMGLGMGLGLGVGLDLCLGVGMGLSLGLDLALSLEEAFGAGVIAAECGWPLCSQLRR